MDHTFLLKTLSRVARDCGAIIREASGTLIRASEKSGVRDLVTAYDLQVQAFALGALSEAFPGARFIGEEGDTPREAGPGLTFVIDPIDGTANFVHHFHQSSTSIACFLDGEPLAGAVYNPFVDELFTALKGGGAALNGRPIHVCTGPMAEAMLLFGTSPYEPQFADDTFRFARALFDRVLDVRRNGCASLDLCDVAAGRAGMYFEYSTCLWDYAAGALIVQEAGGVCRTLGGEPLPRTAYQKTSIVAAAPDILEESGILK